MPEYLAPAVYIEEVPSANRPIEGASTSTAAMVGVTLRGPVDTPTLCTSTGAFNRLFGGLLDPRAFTDGLDSLPQAAYGFFANGGSRLYVTRVVGDGASRASAALWGVAPGAKTNVALAVRANAGDQWIALSADDGTGADVDFVLTDGTRSEAASTSGAAAVRLLGFEAPLTGAVADNAAVTHQTVLVNDLVPGPGDMLAGGGLVFTAPPAGLDDGDMLRVQGTDGTHAEYVIVDHAAPLGIKTSLLYDHPAATSEVHHVDVTAGAEVAADGAVPGGAAALLVTDAASFAAGNLVAVVTSGSTEYRIVSGTSLVAPLAARLAYPHPAGTAVQRVVGLMRVHARYPGSWGNALVVRAVPTSLLTGTLALLANPGAQSLSLSSTFGLFAGSTLAVGAPGSVQRVTVASVNRATNEVTLAAPLAVAAAAATPIASQEFNLFVDRYENDKVVESEQFEGLALNPLHARYAPRAVGAFDRQSQTSADSGAAELVRVSDLAKADDGSDLPDAAALRQSSPIAGSSFGMSGGDDDLGSVDDDSFIGAASDDPHLRTGVQALENENSLSIVAVPGRTSVAVQNALIAHCDKMLYRFAVIEPPAGAKLADALAHRQNFDTTRGAIYYPWLDVPDPTGAPGDMIRIPPSGHVMGIYARVDTSRGVWKAPANEVVSGILQFDTALTKGEQDILNPVSVNCFRDFRSVNRGLRLYGGRTLSSDPEFRYVNVRRTLLFIEQSLDTGLQWAVFEPNAEPLWASVKQSITAFLRTVWRDGGLEGTSEDEAFFVSIGYDVTMTQADIDNGRMIVVVGVAVVKPAEFVIVRISQKTRDATS